MQRIFPFVILFRIFQVVCNKQAYIYNNEIEHKENNKILSVLEKEKATCSL